jgi:hypothetical protein
MSWVEMEGKMSKRCKKCEMFEICLFDQLDNFEKEVVNQMTVTYKTPTKVIKALLVAAGRGFGIQELDEPQNGDDGFPQ